MRASTAVVALWAAVASAQSAGNYSSELDMKLDDPNSIPIQQRAVWCRAQTNTCGLLCDSNTNKNSCAQETLVYDCTCAGNNSAPGLQYYTQTIPTFICETLFSRCNDQRVGNADGQLSCINDIQKLCGKLAPPSHSSGGSDEGGSSSGGDSGDSSNTASSSQPSSTQGNSNAAATTTSKGFAAPTMIPAGSGAAVAAIGILAYLI